jgi:hypothetical protein
MPGEADGWQPLTDAPSEGGASCMTAAPASGTVGAVLVCVASTCGAAGGARTGRRQAATEGLRLSESRQMTGWAPLWRLQCPHAGTCAGCGCSCTQLRPRTEHPLPAQNQDFSSAPVPNSALKLPNTTANASLRPRNPIGAVSPPSHSRTRLVDAQRPPQPLIALSPM